MSALLAAAPLVVVLLAMGALRWSAAAAGAAGLGIAVLLAGAVFGVAPEAVPSAAGAVAGILAEAVHSTATILWIILPALALYEYQQRSGGVERMREALSRITGARKIQALLIAWFFGLFMEGAAGFGTPVALAAPLLVGIGFSPVRAVTLALVGHAAGVPFGAVGTPALAQIEITGLPPLDLAATTAGANLVLGFGLLFAVIRVADDGPVTWRDAGWAALAGASFLVPYFALAALAGPELPTLAGALVGLVLFVAMLRTREAASSVGLRALLPDLVPYLLLITLVLATRLVPVLRDALGGLVLVWDLHGVFGGSFAPLFHPGSLLVASVLLGALATGRPALIAPSIAAALRRVAPVGLALFIMLALARIMVHSGMIGVLAESAARAGPAWPLLAASVGAIGTFVSGSATASNILFTQFQISTAAALELTPVLMAAAQGIGAAIGNVVAPHNIIAGCATVGLAGREGSIMQRTAPVCAAYLLAAGGLVFMAAA